MIAIIPARKGSKRITYKNLELLGDKTLIQRTVDYALNVKCISDVYVSTDIENININSKAHIIKRPVELAGGKISSEAVVDHVLESAIKSDYIILMQCTSPFRNDGDIDKALEKMKKEKADSLYFGYPIERWLWKDDKPINYDYLSRPMTQYNECDILVECGDYIFTRELFLDTGCRLGGKIIHYEVDKKCSMDIDDYEDLKMVRSLI